MQFISLPLIIFYYHLNDTFSSTIEGNFYDYHLPKGIFLKKLKLGKISFFEVFLID